jgi:hypothetical protein
MRWLLRAWLAAALTLAACGPATSKSPTANPNPGSRGCTIDADCGGGRCIDGSCNLMPPGPGSGGCTIDSQCPGGSCQFGECTALPPEKR